jgi:hypothetical protein
MPITCKRKYNGGDIHTQYTKNKMPENNHPSAYIRAHYNFFRLVDLINIDIKIIVNHITCSSN